MKSLHQGKKSSRFKRPDGIVSLKVCNATGLRATKKCTETHYEIFARGKEPDYCTESGSKGVEICVETELLANKYCPETITKYTASKAPKEGLKLWQTTGYTSKDKLPTETCTEHDKDNTGTSSKKPTIKLKGSSTITLNIGDTYTEQGATASDKEDGDLTSSIIISGSVNTSTAGTYKVTYKVTNSKNKTTTITRTVIVKANEVIPEPTPEPTETENTSSDTSQPSSEEGNE